MNNETIPPVNRKSGMWATMKDHAAKKNGGWKSWAGSILGGGLIAGVGLGILQYYTTVPWWVGILCIVAGVQVASRGAFVAALKPIKDGAIDLLRAKKDG